jgi:hypothetical protein
MEEVRRGLVAYDVPAARAGLAMPGGENEPSTNSASFRA